MKIWSLDSSLIALGELTGARGQSGKGQNARSRDSKSSPGSAADWLGDLGQSLPSLGCPPPPVSCSRMYKRKELNQEEALELSNFRSSFSLHPLLCQCTVGLQAVLYCFCAELCGPVQQLGPDQGYMLLRPRGMRTAIGTAGESGHVYSFYRVRGLEL